MAASGIVPSTISSESQNLAFLDVSAEIEAVRVAFDNLVTKLEYSQSKLEESSSTIPRPARMFTKPMTMASARHASAIQEIPSVGSEPMNGATYPSESIKSTAQSQAETSRQRSGGTECNIPDTLIVPHPLATACTADKLVPTTGQPTNSTSSAQRGRSSTSNRRSIGTGGAQPQMEQRWRDLYTENEAAAEEQEEDLMYNSVAQFSSAESYGEGRAWICRLPMLHPWSYGRLFWDLISGILVLYDGIMIPVQVAWERDMSQGSFEYTMVLLAAIYWTFDIWINFNTGIINDGVLVMTRRHVASHYMRTWFVVDVALVFIDYCSLTISSLDGLRQQRVLRLLRLIRGSKLLKFFKSGNMSLRIVELAQRYSLTWVIIAFAILKILFFILLIAHVLSCLWYYMGHAMVVDTTWLDIEELAEMSFAVQYTRSLHWVIALMTTNTNDAIISPQNVLERVFAISIILLSILILGAGAATLTSTISDLNRSNTEIVDTRNRLHRYLYTSNVPVERSMHIVRFALHSLKQRDAMTLDPSILSLLSENLVAELTTNHRSLHVVIHPLVNLISVAHSEALHAVCGAFQLQSYSDWEVVFRAKTWAESLYLTWYGVYYLSEENTRTSSLAADGTSSTSFSGSSLASTKNSNESGPLALVERMEGGVVLDQPQWFSEISLFARFTHNSTLSALSFGDAYTLSGQDFAQSVRPFPCCIATVYRYATAFLDQLWDGAEAPPTKILVSDFLPYDLNEKACTAVNAFRTPTDLKALRPVKQGNVDTAKGFVIDLIAGRLDGDEIPVKLVEVFAELDGQAGTYANLEEHAERKRSISAVLSICWLLTNRYESFTESQGKNVMSLELWEEFQAIIAWAALTEEEIIAAFVFLIVRGLGKVKHLSKSIPKEFKECPEDIVLHLIDEAPQIVPSVHMLSDETKLLLETAFKTNSRFNLAQFLQAENCPSHVQQLQMFVQEEGVALLRFYLVNLIGVMSALRGAETLKGSLFMDQKNGSTFVRSIQCLQHLTQATPHAIYWTYISSRAIKLKLPLCTKEDFTIARLACLIRADAPDLDMLKGAWFTLSSCDRRVLVDHFVADGIGQHAFLLSFLPLYFANAKSNKFVGMSRALVVLIELLDLLRSDGCVTRYECMTIQVDLSDLAAFVREAKAPRTVEVVMGFSTIMDIGLGVKIVIATKHWQRVGQKDWHDDVLQEMNHALKKLERKTESVEGVLDEFSRRAQNL